MSKANTTKLNITLNSEDLDEQIKELLNKRLQRMAKSYVEDMASKLDKETLEKRYSELFAEKFPDNSKTDELFEKALENTVERKIRALFWDDKNSTFTTEVKKHIEQVVKDYIDSLDFSDIINRLIEEYFIYVTAGKIKEKVAEQVANMLSDKK